MSFLLGGARDYSKVLMLWFVWQHGQPTC